MEPTQTTPAVKTSYGTLVVLLLIVAVIVFGAFYVLKERIASDEAQVDSLSEQSDSTDPQAIEQDLSAAPPEDFEQDLDEAFVELDAAFEGAAQ